MTTFALVHGSWHGAWCWELLAPLIEREGHFTAAMDLPCEDASASFETYADVVCAALDGCGDDVVLVGHSLGANTIPLVATRRPVAVIRRSFRGRLLLLMSCFGWLAINVRPPIDSGLLTIWPKGT